MTGLYSMYFSIKVGHAVIKKSTDSHHVLLV